MRAKVTAGRYVTNNNQNYKSMEHNPPSFGERTKRLKDAAEQLRTVADVVLAEVQHMEAAQTRFAQRTQSRADKRAQK